VDIRLAETSSSRSGRNHVILITVTQGQLTRNIRPTKVSNSRGTARPTVEARSVSSASDRSAERVNHSHSSGDAAAMSDRRRQTQIPTSPHSPSPVLQFLEISLSKLTRPSRILLNVWELSISTKMIVKGPSLRR